MGKAQDVLPGSRLQSRKLPWNLPTREREQQDCISCSNRRGSTIKMSQWRGPQRLEQGSRRQNIKPNMERSKTIWEPLESLVVSQRGLQTAMWWLGKILGRAQTNLLGSLWSHSLDGHKDYTESDTVQINHCVIILPCLIQNNCQVHLGCISVDHIKSLGSTCILCAQEQGVRRGRHTKHGFLFLKTLTSKRKVNCTQTKISREPLSMFTHKVYTQTSLVKNSEKIHTQK